MLVLDSDQGLGSRQEIESWFAGLGFGHDRELQQEMIRLVNMMFLNEDVFLPVGLSWYPSTDDRQFLAASIPSPVLTDGPNVRYAPLADVTTKKQLIDLLSELYHWREDEGRKLWPKWPYTSTEGGKHPHGEARHPDAMKRLPLGVTVTACRIKKPGRTSPAIRVIAYWQDFSRKRPGGGYYQANRMWQLPLGSTELQVREKIKMARAHRVAMEREQEVIRERINPRKG